MIRHLTPLAAAIALTGVAAPVAAQYQYRVGQIVEANPTQITSGWGKCKILEQGPGPTGYKVTCLMPWSREKEYWSEGYTDAKWIRPMSAAQAAMTPAQVAQTGGAYIVGQTVLASPAGIDSAWQRCRVLDRSKGVVVTGEKTLDSYQLECVNDTADPYGKRIQTLGTYWAKENWMKPNQPGFKPNLQLASARAYEAAYKARTSQVAAQLAKPAPRPAPAGAGGSPRAGSYECWANGYARMNMNFRVTGPGTYRNDSGSGRFSVGPGGRLTLTGPMLEAMPDGFVAVYHTPGGRPTVSFRSPRGAEAAFCELPG